MYELIVLSLLMRFPMHGYLIAHVANDRIGPWAKISNGTLYPLLTKLEGKGLITRTGNVQGASSTDQNTRTYMITDTGRKRFFEIMMDTTSNIGDYQRIFHLKMPFLDLLQPRERLHLLNHYINYCQACILHLTTHSANLEHELTEDSENVSRFKELALNIMHHHSQQWQAEVEWTMQLRTQLIPHTENTTPSA